MAETRKVLGQSYPAAITLTSLYTVPSSTQAVVSCITACNQSAAASATIRISIAVASAADTSAQYFAYDVPLAVTETVTFQVGITLGAADVIRVYSSNGAVSFSAFGVELA